MMKTTVEQYGLVAKSRAEVSDGSAKVINLKIRVDADFYDRWTRTMARISRVYSGGSVAVAHHALVELLPQLEEMAKAIPDTPDADAGLQRATSKKGGGK